MISLPHKRKLPIPKGMDSASFEKQNSFKRRKTNHMGMTPNEFYESRRAVYEVSPLIAFELSQGTTPLNKRESTESKKEESQFKTAQVNPIHEK